MDKAILFQLSPLEVEKDMNAIMQVLIKDAMNDA